MRVRLAPREEGHGSRFNASAVLSSDRAQMSVSAATSLSGAVGPDRTFARTAANCEPEHDASCELNNIRPRGWSDQIASLSLFERVIALATTEALSPTPAKRLDS